MEFYLKNNIPHFKSFGEEIPASFTTIDDSSTFYHVVEYTTEEDYMWLSPHPFIEEVKHNFDLFRASSPNVVLNYLIQHFKLSQRSYDWQEEIDEDGNLTIFSKSLKEETGKVFKYRVIPILERA